MSTAFDPYYKWLGIPADEQPADHYRLLGLRRFENDPEVIQAAADRQMAHVRNYASGPHSDLSQRLLNEIAAAKLQLLEPKKKTAYDQSLRSTIAASMQPPPPQRTVTASLPVGTPLPVAPAITPRPSHAAASAAQPQAFPADIAEFDGMPAPPKRPGRAGGKKSSSGKAVAGMAGSAIALLIVCGFVWMRMNGDSQSASSSSAKHKSTASQTTSTDPASPPTTNKKSAEPVGHPPATQPQPTTPKAKLPDKGESNATGTTPSNGDSPNSTPPKTNPPDATNSTTAQAQGPIDLLALIDPKVDAIQGTWKREETALVSSKEGMVIARIRYLPPPEYLLVMDVERRSGIDAVAAGLLVSGGQTVVAVEGFGTKKTGLSLKPHKWHMAAQDAVLTKKINRLEYRVTSNRVVLDCNGQRVLEWSGDANDLHGDHEWRLRDGNGLFIGTYGSEFVFYKLELRPLDAQSPTLAQVSPVGPTRVIDLLKMTEDANRREGTGLRFDNGALVVEPANGKKINFGYKLPQAYTLTLIVERDGDEPLQNISGTVVVGGRECAWTVDGTRNGDYRSGFRVDNAAYGENETTRNGQFLRPNGPNEIVIKVQGDSASASCNGNLLMQWSGDCDRLGNPQQNSLSLTGWRDKYKVTRLLLTDNTTTDPGGSFNKPTASNSATPASRPINLLKYVDANSVDFQRDWQMDGTNLTSIPGAWRRLGFARVAPEEYDVKVAVERQGAEGSIGWGLWSGSAQVSLFVDAELPGHEGTGLSKVDDKEWFDNETYVNRIFLKQGATSEITCSVRKTGISVAVDGKKVIDWKGDRSHLSNHPSWVMTTPGQLEFRTEGSFKITTLEMTPFGGVPGGSGTFMPGMVQSPTKVSSQPTVPSKPAIAKLPVPNAAAQRESLKLIREEYRSSYEKAKTPDKRFTLAKRLYSASQSSASKPSRCYALLREAADLAADVGQAQDAMVAINELVRRYDVDDLAVQSDVLLDAAKNVRDPDAQRYLVDQASIGIERAIVAERYDLAAKLMKMALAAAAKLKDPDLLKQVREGDKRLGDMQANYRKVEPALSTLGKNPEDAEANLLAGKYYCFSKDDLLRGLPLLAKGSDAVLADLAKRDLDGPQSADEQVKLADAWWDAASSADKPQQAKMKSRATHWYKQALPDLQGLERTRVDKRLDENEESAGAQSVYLDDLQEKSFAGHYPALGKHGKTGFQGEVNFKSQATTHAHALFAVPLTNSNSRVVYELPRGYKRLRAVASLSDDSDLPHTATTFKVIGDGRELWKSKPIRNRNGIIADSDTCDVNITGVRQLELIVDCPGSDFGSNTVWLNPQISK